MAMTRSFYTVDEVRDAAAGTAFGEIGHNEASRVISFRSSTTRINVYYTTGTVATCLNHPTRGKTQLFRRRVGLELLYNIFVDPRLHTGRGYYRTNNRQSWKTVRENGSAVFEVDSARRWTYVATATGLSTDVSELARIVEFCNLYDSIYWDPGVEPKLSLKKFDCGSQTALTNMLFEASREMLGVPVKGVYLTRPDPTKKAIYGMQVCCRQNLENFLRAHGADLPRLKNLLAGVSEDVRIEMIQWFFGRDNCGYGLTVGETGTLLTTSYSGLVRDAHMDYADLAYTRTNAARMCEYHGVLWDGWYPGSDTD